MPEFLERAVVNGSVGALQHFYFFSKGLPARSHILRLLLAPPSQRRGVLLQLIFTLLEASQDLGLARAHRKHWASEEMKNL